MHCDLSIIIPVYNEEENLPLLETELQRILQLVPGSCEVVFVDDGSRDGSFAALEAIVARRPWARVLKLRRNFGQTQAMAAGFAHARGDVLVCMDADLQNDPEDIPKLLETMERGYDIVSGWRKKRRDRFVTRRIPSICANWLIGRIVGVRLHDYGCSLKAYNAEIMKSLHLYSDMHRFLPALAWKCGARVTEIPVNHRPRVHGQSKYGLSRVVKVALDLAVVKLIVDFSSRPMHAFGAIAALFFLGMLFLVPFFVINLVEGYRNNLVLPSLIMLTGLAAIYFLVIGVLADLIVRVGRHDVAEYARATAVETA